ncbi:MAG: hypothetical protein Q9M36_02970 [Sulfurovum sp.]|nr:hypothetical protein [Sulfurovum sp.]
MKSILIMILSTCYIYSGGLMGNTPEEKANASKRLSGAMMGKPNQKELLSIQMRKENTAMTNLLRKRLINYKIPMGTMRRKEKLKSSYHWLTMSYEEEFRIVSLEHKELRRLINVHNIKLNPNNF